MERIEKFLTQNGICSRQDAKRLLRKKKIFVNGELVTQVGYKLDPQKDKVEVDGMEIAAAEQDSYIILNKPKGYITSRRDRSGVPTVFELLPLGASSEIHAVGRLDVDSTGLLLFVNDGNLTHKLTHPKHHVEKEYEVEIKGELTDKIKKILKKGIELDGKRTKPCRIFNIKHSGDSTSLNITISEGKNRQVRRMFGQFDLPVTSLKRIRFGEILLSDLQEGQTRNLNETEINYIKGVGGINL